MSGAVNNRQTSPFATRWVLPTSNRNTSRELEAQFTATAKASHSPIRPSRTEPSARLGRCIDGPGLPKSLFRMFLPDHLRRILGNLARQLSAFSQSNRNVGV